MFLILNKENNYRENKSKITAMEIGYSNITKLISNQEGDLNTSMLMAIKAKQELTNTSLDSTLALINPIFLSLSIPFSIVSKEYNQLKDDDLKSYQEGYINYVDIVLLKKIMMNEKTLSNAIKKIYENIVQAEKNFYYSNQTVRNKATQRNVYVPPEFQRVDTKTIKISTLVALNENEKNEFSRVFYALKFLYNYTSTGWVELPIGSQIPNTQGTINVNNPRIQVYVKSSSIIQSTNNVYTYLDSVYVKMIPSGEEYKIGDFTRGGRSDVSPTRYAYSYDINENTITEYRQHAGSMREYLERKITTFVATPSVITAAYINSNF